MTFSQKNTPSSETNGELIPKGKLAYYRGRFSHRIYDLVMDCFADSKVSKADLSRRLGRDAALINRWLAMPGNWESDTVSDLMLAIGYEMHLSATRIGEAAQQIPPQGPQLPTQAEALAAQNDPHYGVQKGAVGLPSGSAFPTKASDESPRRKAGL
jgi:hypothetical protein